MGAKENDVQNAARLALSEMGVPNWRNHTGFIKDENGVGHRFGLCNGSSDVIGIMPVEITEEMVGKTLGLFFAGEAKQGNAKPTKDQRVFLDVVNQAGGIGIYFNSAEDCMQKVYTALQALLISEESNGDDGGPGLDTGAEVDDII